MTGVTEGFPRFDAPGHDVDIVIAEGLTGAPDEDVVAEATATDRILISLDRRLGDIRRAS